MPSSHLRSASRLPRVAVHLGLGLGRVPADRAERRWVRRQWARQLLDMLGIALHSVPISVPPGTLVVANHVSWLDVFVLNTLFDCSFVAKAEIAGWPFFGALLRAHDTLYVDRRPGRHLLAVNARIAERLGRGDIVVFFPEGTTTDGSVLLPFRSALFQSAINGGHPVQPFALEYTVNGERCGAAAFVNDQTLLQSLACVARLGGLTVRVEAGKRIDARGLGRKSVAALAREEVYRRLCAGSSHAARPVQGGMRSAWACSGASGPGDTRWPGWRITTRA